jgi:hypothetical protein
MLWEHLRQWITHSQQFDGLTGDVVSGCVEFPVTSVGLEEYVTGWSVGSEAAIELHAKGLEEVVEPEECGSGWAVLFREEAIQAEHFSGQLP